MATDATDKAANEFIAKELFKSRIITFFGEMNQKRSQQLAEKILALAYQNDKNITIYINSPGGHVESGDTIFDLIRTIKPKVTVVGTGYVASIAAHIYLAGELENRLCLPNTRFLLHQPSGGSQGQAADIAIQAKEILRTKERINRIIAERTGQPLERVQKDTDRDYWMSAEEAINYGMVSRVIQSWDDIS